MLLRRTVLTLALAAMASLPVIGASHAQSHTIGPVLLTVTGAVGNANRGAFDPEEDKFFGYNEVEFSSAKGFDYNELSSLDMVKVNADFPKGANVYEYEGPLLADVLKAAGAEGEMVTMQALDGYAIEVPLKELVDAGAVVALKRDGTHLGIGDYGPTHIVFPRADRADLADMPDDNWIWSIFHIKVE